VLWVEKMVPDENRGYIVANPEIDRVASQTQPQMFRLRCALLKMTDMNKGL